MKCLLSVLQLLRESKTSIVTADSTVSIGASQVVMENILPSREIVFPSILSVTMKS